MVEIKTYHVVVCRSLFTICILQILPSFGACPIFNADERTKSLGEEEYQDKPFFRSLFYKYTSSKRVDDSHSKNSPHRLHIESFKLSAGTVSINKTVKAEYG